MGWKRGQDTERNNWQGVSHERKASAKRVRRMKDKEVVREKMGAHGEEERDRGRVKFCEDGISRNQD